MQDQPQNQEGMTQARDEAMPQEWDEEPIEGPRKRSLMKKLGGGRGRMVIGLVMALSMVIIALAAPLIATHDPYRTAVRERFLAPSAENLMGTDEFGRDVFSRVVYGARVSMFVGVGVVAFSTVAGTVIGLLSGYFRRVDNILMRVMDALMAFPSILLAIAILAALGPHIGNVIIALSIVYTPRTARVVRGQVLSVREEAYVESARAVGLGNLRIIYRYILPNVMAPLIVQATFILALTIIAEAGLSYIGAGTPPPTPSWGNILADGRPHMYRAAWMTTFPGLFIMIAVLGLNIFGDGLRDVLDPRQKES